MSFHVEIEMHDASVLILGGGNVALRKTKQCLQEGANVFVLSKEIKEEFLELPVSILSHPYHSELLSQYLFCIVCTNDKQFNEQVFQDAKRLHCLCMGVHHEDFSTMHPLVSKDFGDFQIAVSTKGNFPAITSQLVDRAGSFLVETQGDRLQLLSNIRKLLTKGMEATSRQEFCRLLCTASYALLLQIKQILQFDDIRILCYHGVKDECALNQIKSFEARVQQKYPTEKICSAYLSKAVCNTVNLAKQQVLELAVFLPYFHQLHKTIILQPMLFQKGAYFDSIEKWDTYSNVFVKEPIFAKDEEIEELCNTISFTYATYDQIFVCYHSSKNGNFSKQLKKIAPKFSNMYFFREVQIPVENHSKGNRILLLSLTMLSGKHSKDTLEKVQELRGQGYDVTYIEQSMIELAFLRDLLLKKI